MPGVRYPENTGKINVDKNSYNEYYCSEISSWYNETKSGEHSPIVGFMADGIPIYGPYTKSGKAPTDLDECGGHSSDFPPVHGVANHKTNLNSFYHYHFQMKYPYSINCLKGCVNSNMNKKINNDCDEDKTIKYNYTSLQSIKVKYGGSGVNSTSWTGPASLLSFGFTLFLPSAIFCLCLCCSSRKEQSEFKGSLADMEEYDEHAGDNVL